MAGRKSEAGRAAAKEPSSVRARMAADLDRNYDLLMKVIEDALSAERQVRIDEPCEKCGCAHIRYVKVRDTGAALKAAEFLANQGLGRPGEDQTRVESVFTVERYVVEPIGG